MRGLIGNSVRPPKIGFTNGEFTDPHLRPNSQNLPNSGLADLAPKTQFL